MIKAIIQKKPYVPEIGDILSGSEFIVRKVKNDEKLGNFIFANAISHNPWITLKKLDIDAEQLKKEFEYKDPFTDNTYYHFIPLAIIVKDVNVYRKGRYSSKDCDYLFDVEWNTSFVCKDKHPELNSISKSMLGHGYTDGTLPNDGDGKHIEVLIELDNGDFLFGYCWEWYNK